MFLYCGEVVFGLLLNNIHFHLLSTFPHQFTIHPHQSFYLELEEGAKKSTGDALSSHSSQLERSGGREQEEIDELYWESKVQLGRERGGLNTEGV